MNWFELNFGSTPLITQRFFASAPAITQVPLLFSSTVILRVFLDTTTHRTRYSLFSEESSLSSISQ